MPARRPTIGVAVGLWADRPPEETLHTAALAAEFGYPELWIGESTSYDAFSLATAVGLATTDIDLTVGPLAVQVRDAAMIAMGAASVASLTRHRTSVAIGTSSRAVCEWHGRELGDRAKALASAARDVAPLLAGDVAAPDHAGALHLRLDPSGSGLTVAALGERAVRVAAEHAERAVVSLAPAAAVAGLRQRLDAAAKKAERAAPRLAVWLPTAVDPTPESLAQLVRALVPYLPEPGYGEMFAEAGFAEVVQRARDGVPTSELVAALPLEIVSSVALVGAADTVARKIDEYVDAGADEIVVAPATAGDTGGRRTLRAMREL